MERGVGMGLTMDEQLRQAAKKAARNELPLAPDGPVIERFDPKRLAAALELELARSRARGWPRITIHMDLDDAAKLAHALRRVK